MAKRDQSKVKSKSSPGKSVVKPTAKPTVRSAGNIARPTKETVRAGQAGQQSEISPNVRPVSPTYEFRDGKPGPVAQDLSIAEQETYLGHRRSGMGMFQALERMRIGHGRLKRTRQNNAEFDQLCKQSDAYIVDTLVSLQLRAAVQGDEKAQQFLIARADKAKQFSANLRVKHQELALKRSELESTKETDNPVVNAIRAILLAKSN